MVYSLYSYSCTAYYTLIHISKIVYLADVEAFVQKMSVMKAKGLVTFHLLQQNEGKLKKGDQT